MILIPEKRICEKNNIELVFDVGGARLNQAQIFLKRQLMFLILIKISQKNFGAHI